MARSLIVGMGEVGQALSKVIEDAQTLDLEKKVIKKPIDILHICIPYTDKFVSQVKEYQRKYRPLVTVIYSTVPIGTSKKLGAMHSPIEGTHPNLEEGIRKFTRFIGSDNGHYPVDEFWANLKVRVRLIDSTASTEFLKLRSTAKYGINLMWADYEKSVTDKLGINYQDVKDFDLAYNALFRPSVQENRIYQRYVLDPPEGKIGGHCILPNADILNEQFPHSWLEELREYGL